MQRPSLGQPRHHPAAANTPPAPAWLHFGCLQAVALVSGVEHRLGSKLRRSKERQLAAEVQASSSGGGDHRASGSSFGAAQHSGFYKHARRKEQPGWGKQDKAARQQQGAAVAAGAAAAGAAQADEDEAAGGSSDEDGRGGAFGKGKQAAQRPPTFSKGDLLKASEAARGKKRKRKGG